MLQVNVLKNVAELSIKQVGRHIDVFFSTAKAFAYICLDHKLRFVVFYNQTPLV